MGFRHAILDSTTKVSRSTTSPPPPTPPKMGFRHFGIVLFDFGIGSLVCGDHFEPHIEGASYQIDQVWSCSYVYRPPLCGNRHQYNSNGLHHLLSQSKGFNKLVHIELNFSITPTMTANRKSFTVYSRNLEKRDDRFSCRSRSRL